MNLLIILLGWLGLAIPGSTGPVIVEAEPAHYVQPSRDFWYWLRMCESEDGRTSPNLYQFHPGTWRAAGGTGSPGSATRETQTAIAQRWASNPQVNPAREWPVCWPRALRQG